MKSKNINIFIAVFFTAIVFFACTDDNDFSPYMPVGTADYVSSSTFASKLDRVKFDLALSGNVKIVEVFCGSKLIDTKTTQGEKVSFDLSQSDLIIEKGQTKLRMVITDLNGESHEKVKIIDFFNPISFSLKQNKDFVLRQKKENDYFFFEIKTDNAPVDKVELYTKVNKKGKYVKLENPKGWAKKDSLIIDCANYLLEDTLYLKAALTSGKLLSEEIKTFQIKKNGFASAKKLSLESEKNTGEFYIDLVKAEQVTKASDEDAVKDLKVVLSDDLMTEFSIENGEFAIAETKSFVPSDKTMTLKTFEKAEKVSKLKISTKDLKGKAFLIKLIRTIKGKKSVYWSTLAVDDMNHFDYNSFIKFTVSK